MQDVVIVDAARSPVGRKNGSLGGAHPTDERPEVRLHESPSSPARDVSAPGAAMGAAADARADAAPCTAVGGVLLARTILG